MIVRAPDAVQSDEGMALANMRRATDMLGAINLFAAASLVLGGASEGAPSGTIRRFHARVGSCDVTAVAPSRTDGPDTPADRDPGLRRNAFYVQFGAKTLLVAPIGLIREERGSQGVPEAVILTSLDRGQLRGVMDGDKPAFPNSSLLVDRALVDGALDPGSAGSEARSVLAVYQAIGRLRITEPDAPAMSGVMIAISPERPRLQSRVRIGCGPITLMLLPSREMAFASSPVGGHRREDLPRILASDAFVVAVTDGGFPGIGRVYAEHDGYHWGSIEARSLSGALSARGKVTVEVSDPDAGEGGHVAARGAATACTRSVPCREQAAGPIVTPK